LQYVLIRAFIKEFGARFVPGGALHYAGDTRRDKWGYVDPVVLAELGIAVDSHGKMPEIHPTPRG
jgi:hypothetical protein